MDAISEMIIFISIGASPYVNPILALIALAGYQAMSNLVFITTSVKGEFKISYGSLGPTEVRALAVIGNTIMFYLGNPIINLPFSLPFFGTYITLYNLLVYCITILLFFFFFYTTITQAVELERKDRKKYMKKVKKNKKRLVEQEA
jgi:archaetidylinositol phosphate synthase